MATEQSGHGRIEVFEDFLGPESQLASTATPSSATGALLNFGALVVRGDAVNDADAGIVPVADALSGVGRFTSPNNSEGDAVYLGTEVCLSVVKMAPIILECRVEMQALDDRRFYMGLCGSYNDAQTDVCEDNGSGTIALTESNQCGFLYDVGLTESVKWYMPFKGGTATGVLDASEIVSSVTPVLQEFDILRLEVDPNGTARWFINGVLEQTVSGAISTTVVHAALIGSITATGTMATADVDYFYISANRDWTV